MGAVDLLADIVGEVENGRGASWTQHAVVHRLDHPANFLSEGQVLRGREGQVGGVKGGRRDSGIVGVESCHVVAGVGLNEHSPSCGCRRTAVRPREGGRAVCLKGMRCGVPHDGTAGGSCVYAADGRRCHGAVFPRQGEIRPFAGAPFGRRERDEVVGLARGVDHQRNVVLTPCQRSLNGFRHIKVHPVVLDAVHEINITTDVRADGTAAALCPCVGAVVGRGVGRGGPWLQHRAYGHGFILHRARFGKETQFGARDSSTIWLRNFAEWNANQGRRLISSGCFTNVQGGGILLCIIRTWTVFDDVGVHQMRCIQVRKSTVMAQFNRSLGGVVDNGVEVGKLEVVGVGPVADLVGGRNGANTPVPSVALIKVGLEREGSVGDVKPCIVPRRVSEAVHR